MIKELVSGFDFSDSAVLALLLFVGCFLLIIFGAMRLSRRAVERCAAIPLSDDPMKDTPNE